jgi:hypothetical protein
MEPMKSKEVKSDYMSKKGSVATEGGVLKSSWKLPTNRTALPLGKTEIATEFRRLDLMGEGRLTYLSLKTALELREVAVSDHDIRNWIREYDLGSKGYVDLSDYEHIYREAGTLNAKINEASLNQDVKPELSRNTKNQLNLTKKLQR